MRIGLILAIVLVAIGSVAAAHAWFPDLAAWAVEQQRAFQTEIARAVHALRAGETGAMAILISAAAAYGFVHAVGPGHGKFVVGGVGLGSHVTALRLFGIGMVASAAQALWAIILVYGGFWILETSAQQLTMVTEDVLAPASYVAIGLIGAILMWRGAIALASTARARTGTGTPHAHDTCGCPSHHLQQEDIERLGSVRDVLVLILSIAVRPCTGAVLLLVIAWQLDLLVAGVAAVAAMGFGTGALVSLVAVSSVKLRGLVQLSTTQAGLAIVAAPILQLLAGGMIIWFSVSILYASGAIPAI